jgi:phage host-nuclease inhibitor protein Gam
MAKRLHLRQPFTRREHELMEVHGFDLLAQIEAMLRHVRQYQREVQRLRGLMGKGQTTTSDLPPVEAVDQHLKRLREACSAFTETLDDLLQIHETAAGTRAAAQERRKLLPRSKSG